MTDSVGDNVEMTSKNVATSIMTEVGLDPTEEALEPLTDACHRLLEFGVPEAALHDIFTELFSEIQRTGILSTSYEDADADDEDEETSSFKSDHLFNPREDDAY